MKCVGYSFSLINEMKPKSECFSAKYFLSFFLPFHLEGKEYACGVGYPRSVHAIIYHVLSIFILIIITSFNYIFNLEFNYFTFSFLNLCARFFFFFYLINSILKGSC